MQKSTSSLPASAKLDSWLWGLVIAGLVLPFIAITIDAPRMIEHPDYLPLVWSALGLEYLMCLPCFVHQLFRCRREEESVSAITWLVFLICACSTDLILLFFYDTWLASLFRTDFTI
jgi:hypothetical protein